MEHNTNDLEGLILKYQTVLDSIKSIITDSPIEIIVRKEKIFHIQDYRLLSKRVEIMKEMNLIVAQLMHQAIRDLYRYSIKD